MESVGASEKVFEFIDRKPVIRHNGKLKPATLKGHLEFKDVVFSYPSRPETEVLKVPCKKKKKCVLILYDRNFFRE